MGFPHVHLRHTLITGLHSSCGLTVSTFITTNTNTSEHARVVLQVLINSTHRPSKITGLRNGTWDIYYLHKCKKKKSENYYFIKN